MCIWRGLILAAILAGCGSGEPTDYECSRGARSGTYLMDYDTIDGDCGDIPASLTPIGKAGGQVVGTGCSRAYEVWSDDECAMEASDSCVLADGALVQAVGVTRQGSADGDLVTGVLALRIVDPYGGYVCAGTYRIHAVRQ